MCHLGTHTHSTVQTSTTAAAVTAHIWHLCSQHAGRLDTSRHHGWRRGDDGDLHTIVASLAAMVKDCCNMSWSMSPSAWTWHGGQRRERRRLGQQLLLQASCSGGDRGPGFHDVVVEKCVLTAGLGEGNTTSAEKG